MSQNVVIAIVGLRTLSRSRDVSYDLTAVRITTEASAAGGTMNEWTVDEWKIDAADFQNQLGELATTIAYKVQREGFAVIGSKTAVADIYVTLRLAQRTYDLLFYLNADEVRVSPHWRAHYTFAVLPVIRSMIDYLYNITVMLDDPKNKPADFRRSGYRMAFESLKEVEQKHDGGGDPRWAAWLKGRRESLEVGMRRDGFEIGEVMAQKPWPTLSNYLRPKKGVALTEHQRFLRSLTFGFWREYSAYSHGTFQGLLRIAMPYLEQDLPHEERPKVAEASLRYIFDHVARASAILLCILTELQAYFRFDGARINERLVSIWKTLIPAPEVDDLYKARYEQLMKDRGVSV